MATRWSPDTCRCKLEYDGQPTGDPTFVKTIQRCQEPSHKNAVGAAHLTVLLEHNRGFNRKYTASEVTMPANWKNELDIRGIGVNERALATVLNRTDVIDVLDKQEEIASDKVTEAARINALGPPTRE